MLNKPNIYIYCKVMKIFKILAIAATSMVLFSGCIDEDDFSNKDDYAFVYQNYLVV